MTYQKIKTITLIWLLLLMTACGGGGGGGDNGGGGGNGGGGNGGGGGGGNPPPDPPPFGLTSRQSLATLDLPFSTGGALGTYQLSSAFNVGFSNPVLLVGVPEEDRAVVIEQGGQMHAFNNDPATSSSRVVLNLAGRVVTDSEQGLLGLAFDPNFTQNRYIYVHYSVLGPRRSVIARFTWDQAQDEVDIDSEKILLELNQPGSNHNGGMLAFGPDGYLYIAFGDGGGGNRHASQDRTNLYGSILRIDVHPQNPSDNYDIPADNPFVGEGGGVREEIWAYGFRNPYRFSFDRQTGDLWVGDVGESNFEEIDIVSSGQNHGWPVYEGEEEFDDSQNSLPRSSFTFPVYVYNHDVGAAIIGGFVYRGTRFSALQGRYIYTDFVSGTVWALNYDGSSVVSNDELVPSSNFPRSLGEDNNGELYVLSSSGSALTLEETVPGGGEALPVQLSDTGIFTDMTNLTPASGLIEYDLNQPFWSDNAVKRRWMGIPDGQTITFDATGAWQFPVGTVLIKHFEMLLTEGDANSARRLETRLLIHTDSGWEGYTYRWNVDETDATLLSGRETETITVNLAGGGTRDQLYEYPSRANCSNCHTQVAGFALGLRTRQLNRDFDYTNATDNQLRSLNNIDLFSTDIGSDDDYAALPALDDTSVSVEQRARAYLAVNCAQCHQPGGPTPVNIDLRFDTAANNMNILSAAPQVGDLGLTNAAIVRPGNKEQSVLWERLRRTDTTRMPPIGSHLVDDEAVTVIGEWIDGL